MKMGKRVAALVAAGLAAAATGVVAPATAGVALAATSRPAAATARTVWVRDCPGDRFRVEPKAFVLTCADANTAMTGITWKGWGTAHAVGHGTLVENTCTPTCVAGRFESEPAKITLSHLGHRAGHRDYGHVFVRPLRPNRHHFRVFSAELYY